MKCVVCGREAEFIVNDTNVCDFHLMDVLGIVDPSTLIPITYCPPGMADGYASMQPSYVVSTCSKKPNLDQIDIMLNHFIPKVI